LIIKLKWARLNQSVNDFKKKKKNANDLQNVCTFWILIVEAAKDGIRMLRHRASLDEKVEVLPFWRIQCHVWFEKVTVSLGKYLQLRI
jgi:hypothetical protein